MWTRHGYGQAMRKVWVAIIRSGLVTKHLCQVLSSSILRIVTDSGQSRLSIASTANHLHIPNSNSNTLLHYPPYRPHMHPNRRIVPVCSSSHRLA